MRDDDARAGLACQRRTLLEAGLGAGLALGPMLLGGARAEEVAPDGSEKPPQIGDHFIYLTGQKKGQLVRVDDLPMGGPQVQAYPADPNGVVRNGSLLNLVILARVGADGADEETAARMADGVVAYSGVCTHQGCPVNMWSKEKQAFVCSCHGSTYDPKHGAQLLFGPAPRPIAGLPLKSDNGVLLVAGPFTRKPGIAHV